MRDQSGDGIISAAHFGDLQRHVVVVKSARVRDLSARLGINRRAVEDDFRFFAGFEFLHFAVFCDDGFDVAVARRGAKIKIRLRLECVREFSVDGTGGFFVRAFPRSLRALLLLLHSTVKLSPSDVKTAVSRHIFDKISRKAIRIVKLECRRSIKRWFRDSIANTLTVMFFDELLVSLGNLNETFVEGLL